MSRCLPSNTGVPPETCSSRRIGLRPKPDWACPISGRRSTSSPGETSAPTESTCSLSRKLTSFIGKPRLSRCGTAPGPPARGHRWSQRRRDPVSAFIFHGAHDGTTKMSPASRSKLRSATCARPLPLSTATTCDPVCRWVGAVAPARIRVISQRKVGMTSRARVGSRNLRVPWSAEVASNNASKAASVSAHRYTVRGE